MSVSERLTYVLVMAISWGPQALDRGPEARRQVMDPIVRSVIDDRAMQHEVRRTGTERHVAISTWADWCGIQRVEAAGVSGIAG